MNIIWFAVLRPLYACGLPVAIVLMALMLAGGITKDASVTVPVLAGCVLYLALGYWVFVVAPRWLKSRLLRQIPAGFSPRIEATSVMFNRYLGIDPEHRKACFVDVNDGTKKVLDLDAVASWQLVSERDKASLLTVVTRAPGLPAFGLRLAKSESMRVAAQLQALMH